MSVAGKLDLAALKALHDAATKGEWSQGEDKPWQIWGNEDSDVGIIADDMFCADAAFIVAAHNHWLELLAMAGRAAPCVDLHYVCGGCGFKWPERSAYDELTFENVRLRAEKAAMAERLKIAVRELNEILRASHHCRNCDAYDKSIDALDSIEDVKP